MGIIDPLYLYLLIPVILPHLDAEVEVTMDLSNRPCITHNLSLSSNPNDEEYAGDLSVEMLDHVIESLVMNSKSTVHILEKKVGKTVLETALATPA